MSAKNTKSTWCDRNVNKIREKHNVFPWNLRTKYEIFERLQKEHISNFIHQYEELAKKRKSKSYKIKDCDLYHPLPPKLYQRVSKIISMPNYDYEANIAEDLQDKDDIDFMLAEANNAGGLPTMDEDNFAEENLPEVIEQEAIFPTFELKMEKKISRKKSKDRYKESWMSEYICLDRKDRIKWDSKIYKKDKDIYEKPLFEQAEIMMDAAAERFSEWINQIGSDRTLDISKDLLKSLFSVEGGMEWMAGVHIEPKQVHAVPATVAERWDIPDMAIELKLEDYLEEIRNYKPKKINKIAFGRNIPHELIPWVPMEMDSSIQPVFPEDLLTKKTLFKGIGHLRSTNLLKDFYMRRPKLERPKYLEDTGYFKKKVGKTTSKADVPLYDLLEIN